MAFTGLVKKFSTLGAVLLGISPDKPEIQKKFKQNHKLGMPLLADTDRKVLEKYGAFGEKKMYGKIVKGVIRSTFLIDPQGIVARIWNNVRVEGHAEAVLEDLGGRL